MFCNLIKNKENKITGMSLADGLPSANFSTLLRLSNAKDAFINYTRSLNKSFTE
jgi:hypothetical protein